MRTVESILNDRRSQITRLTTARLQFVHTAYNIGIPPERALGGLDFLMTTGMSQAEALIFVSRHVLEHWPPDIRQ